MGARRGLSRDQQVCEGLVSGSCVFWVAHRGVSQRGHITGTFPAENKTNMKSLEIKLIKPQCGACLFRGVGPGARGARPGGDRQPGCLDPLAWGLSCALWGA